MKPIITFAFLLFSLFLLADDTLFVETFGDTYNSSYLTSSGRWASASPNANSNDTPCEGSKNWCPFFASATGAKTVYITIPSGGAAKLTFDYKFDKSWGTMPVVNISENGGAYTLLKTLNYQTNCKTEIIDLSTYCGSNISIEFRSDDTGAKFQVDNISVTHSASSCSSVYFEEDFGTSVQPNYLTNNGWCHADSDNNNASNPCDGYSCEILGIRNNRTGTFTLDATAEDIVLSFEYTYDDAGNSTAQPPIVSIKSGSNCNNNYNQILQLENHLTCYSVSTVIPASYYGGDVHLKFLTYNSGGIFVLDNIKVQKCDAVLPVELMSFVVKPQDMGVVLEWKTGSEVNSSFFEIERSFDGETFEYIGEIQANGNSNSVINYQYIDNEPNNKQTYYRLKQVDFDGMFEYSKIISIQSPLKTAKIKIYQNRNCQAVFKFKKSYTGTINIFDLTGRLVCSQKLTNNSEAVVSNLNHGVYIVQIMDDKQIIFNQKLFFQ